MKKMFLAWIALCLLCGMLFSMTSCAFVALIDKGIGSGDSYGEDWDGDVEGSYFFFENGVRQKFSVLRLDDGAWYIQNEGIFFDGTYTVDGGRITLMHTVNASLPQDQELMKEFGLKDGETVPLYGGRVADSVVVMDEMLGKKQTPEIALYSFDRANDPNDSNRSVYDGRYPYAGSEEGGEGSYVNLHGRHWTVSAQGETMTGSYAVLDGKLVMFLDVFPHTELEKELMEKYDLGNGDMVMLFGGRIENGRITLDELMCEKQSPAMVFQLED